MIVAPRAIVQRGVAPDPAPLVLIGGGTTPDGAALGAFISLARGRAGGRIVVLTTAASDPAASARQWHRDFATAGCGSVEVPLVTNRQEACEPQLAELLAGADGIFLGGGDQVRLIATLGGTRAAAAIWDAHVRGVVVGGTSAGAAALAKTTLAGNETDETGQLVEQHIGPGLGLISEPCIIDTHFSQRRRLYRLFVALAEHPSLLGLGIDEDTALVLGGRGGDGVGTGTGEVVGTGGVTFVDGRGVRYSNAGSRRDGTPLTLSAVRVGVIGAGHSFDMQGRDMFTPAIQAAIVTEPAVERVIEPSNPPAV